jgi:hypothetical protein
MVSGILNKVKLKDRKGQQNGENFTFRSFKTIIGNQMKKDGLMLNRNLYSTVVGNPERKRQL